MEVIEEYLEEDFVIWNSTLGIRDFVTIGEVENEAGITNVWLDDPYDMVGPFSIKELIACGQISFAACIVMTQQRWHEGKEAFLQESHEEQCRLQKELNEELKRHRKERAKIQKDLGIHCEKEHRELLDLPLEGTLEVTQIKAAFRKVAKTEHPDVGGSHEHFVKITSARDALLDK